MKPIALLAPAPFDAISGGYEYDRQIVAGLRAAGRAIDVIEVSDDAASAWQAVDAAAIPVIDGLALPRFAAFADAMVARGAVALIHHPTALETGTHPDERTRLRDIEQAILPRLARIIVTSETTRDTLVRDFAVTAERVAVVAPGTADAPRSAAAPAGDPVCHILSLGTLVPRKGHDVLLRALARLFDLDWQLTIVGSTARDPAHAEHLAALASTLDIAGRVTFAGEADDRTLAALWSRSQVFALATFHEGYGMAVAEALKRGLPVAVCSGGAAAALVTPESGVVCPPGDAEQLSKALRRLIFDRPLRERMAEAAWQVGQALPGWPEQAARFADALTQEGTS